SEAVPAGSRSTCQPAGGAAGFSQAKASRRCAAPPQPATARAVASTASRPLRVAIAVAGAAIVVGVVVAAVVLRDRAVVVGLVVVVTVVGAGVRGAGEAEGGRRGESQRAGEESARREGHGDPFGWGCPRWIRARPAR